MVRDGAPDSATALPGERLLTMRPPFKAGLSHMTNFSRRSWLPKISQRVVPANAGPHHPWPHKGKKASVPVRKLESAPYGSLRSQGRLIENSICDSPP